MNIPAASLVLLLLGSAAVQAQEYELLFQRQAKIGEKYLVDVAMEDNNDMTMTADSKPMPARKSDVKAQMTAWEEDLGATQKGDPTESRITVKSFSGSDSGKDLSTFRTGDEIHLRNNVKPREVVVNGSPATLMQRRLLAGLFTYTDEHGTNDDLVYTPGRKVKVGETWPIHGDAMAKFALEGGGTPPENPKGTVTIESANPKNGIPCLQVKATFTAQLSDFKPPNKMADFVAKKLDMIVKLTRDLPVDKDLRRQGESMESVMDIDGAGTMENAGKKYQITIRSLVKMSRSRKILPSS